jgi:hypothetical protein
VAVWAKKMDPSGPRALLVLWTGPLRYLIEVSIVVCDSVEDAINACARRDASPTIAEEIGR